MADNDIFDLHVGGLEQDNSPDTAKKKKYRERDMQVLALRFQQYRNDANFGDLVERVNYGLHCYINKIVKDVDGTADVFTKTIEAIYTKIDQFDPKRGNFSTWMYKIAYHNAIKHVKGEDKMCSHYEKLNVDVSDMYDSKNKGTENTFQDSGVDLADVCDYIVTGSKVTPYTKERLLTEIYDASIKSIDDLPDNLRLAMTERLKNKKKIKDIALDNDVPESTLKNWIIMGRKELCKIIKVKYPELYSVYKNMNIE